MTGVSSLWQSSSGSNARLARGNTGAPGGIRTPNLLIRRPGRNPAVSPWSFAYGGDPTGSVHLVSLASRPRCCHGCCQHSPRIQAREPIRSADPHDVRGRSAVTVVRDTIEGWRGFANSVQHLRH